MNKDKIIVEMPGAEEMNRIHDQHMKDKKEENKENNKKTYDYIASSEEETKKLNRQILNEFTRKELNIDKQQETQSHYVEEFRAKDIPYTS